jgi:hypothetical protein
MLCLNQAELIHPFVHRSLTKLNALIAPLLAASILSACAPQPAPPVADAPPAAQTDVIASNDDAPPMFTPPVPDETVIAPGSAEDVSFDLPPPFFDPKPSDAPVQFFTPPAIQTEAATDHRILKAPKGGKPIKFEKTKIKGIPLYKVVIDLDDPQTIITIALPHGVQKANSSSVSHGDETFDSYNKRLKGAFLANGTFFSKDDEKRVMGNMVSEGKFLKYSEWENYGTTLGIKANNELEMVTARREGQPKWDDYWFSITCGPRLVKQGEVEVAAEDEGFQDSHVFTIGPRCAIGFNRKKHQLIYCAFLNGLSLQKEAELMKALGCDEAMNLDGGASRALSLDGHTMLKAGRPLTNVLVVYDTKHPAPSAAIDSWNRFQDGERPHP